MQTNTDTDIQTLDICNVVSNPDNTDMQACTSRCVHASESPILYYTTLHYVI